MWMEGLEEVAETRGVGMKTDRDASWQGLADWPFLIFVLYLNTNSTRQTNRKRLASLSA